MNYMTANAIEIVNLHKSFRPLNILRRPTGQGNNGRIAIDGLTLEVPENQRLAVLGPNGAGKSTLLRILATLVRPTTGSVQVLGHDIDDAPAVRRLIGWATGDERSFYWQLSGLANLQFFAGLQGLRGPEGAERIDYLLRSVGLADASHIGYHAYSSGMRQKLAIARALLHSPKVLLLDEPTRSLDPESADELRRLLHDYAGKSHTIVWVTHNITEAVDYCDRVIWMRAGKIVRDVSSDDRERAVQIPWRQEA